MKKLLIIKLVLVLSLLAPSAYTQIIYSDNDYGCGWENYASSATIENSYEIGVNIALYASGGSASMTIMQVVHSGDYNPDPGSLENLVNQINARTSITASYGGFATLNVTDLSNVNLLYMSGHYTFSLSADEKIALKTYLDNGGVLFVDDCSNYLDNEGFETSFRNLVNELFGASLEILPPDHAVYSSHYVLDGTNFSYSPVGNGTQWNTEPLEWYEVIRTIHVAVDIKPQSCPNPLAVRSKGVLPVAILGTEDFDVTTIDVCTIELAGVKPIRSSLEDVATQLDKEGECECNSEGPDGFLDLTLKFDRQEIIATLGDLSLLPRRSVIPLTLTGMLMDDNKVTLEGTDCIVLLNLKQ